MTGRTVGDIAVRVGADVGPLQKGLKRGAKDLDTFGDRAQVMAGRVAKAGLAITAGLAGAAAAGYGLAKSAASAGAEIERLSTLAGVAPERFQRMAFAAKTVGIEQDKLADILKDVQDRIGDFLQTGGGPMKDFFENIAPQIGVTVEEFKKLNAADALQLYVTSLQRAGLSQNEMAFYMEAMASDLTALLPLLQNGGSEMKRLGDEAAAAGAVLSDDAVKGSQDLLAEFDKLESSIRNKLIEAILDNKEEIKALADDITTVWIPALIEVAKAITKVVNAITTAIETYKIWRDLIRDGEAPGFTGNPMRGGTLDNLGGDGNLSPNEIDPLNGGGGLSPDGANRLYGIGGDDTIQGGDGNDMLLPFVSTQGELETARETLAEHFAAVNDIIAEGVDAKLATLSEGYAREKEMGQEAADADEKLERLKREQRLSAVAGMFGDLSSLMASENEKLFKVGKAAAIAEATVKGYKAAVAAFDYGMELGGMPMALAMSTASLAKTGMLISQISSTTIGGGSSGGGGAGGSSASAGGGGGSGFVNVRVTDIMDQISPDTGVRFGSVGELLKALQDEAGDRGLRFT